MSCILRPFQSAFVIAVSAAVMLFAAPLFAETPAPLKLVVMDPLAAPLSCACVPGMGQRRYDRLASYLERRLGRPVEITFDESLELAIDRVKGQVDLVVGKRSVVEHDARRLGWTLRPLAALTDMKGRDRLTGLVVVRSEGEVERLDQLKGRTIALGPGENAEVHDAAQRLFQRHDPAANWKYRMYKSIDAAVFALADGEVDAALVSDFLPPLLEGCGKIEAGSLRVVAKTDPVPFVTWFAAAHVSEDKAQRIRTALLEVAEDKDLLTALESQRGFIEPATADGMRGWTDWRGPDRAGFSPMVPAQLPTNGIAWTAAVTGPAMAGIAATEHVVVVADKTADLTRDVFRCFDAATGKAVWTVEYLADRPMEYTNAPRACPIIIDDVVFLFGAQGDLHCVALATGTIRWKTNVVERFDARPLNWGQCSPPLFVDGLLIVNPGAERASLAALDANTGKTVWQTPGHASAYGAFLVATLGGRRQIVGYDSAGLGAWDPRDGKPLWTLIPPGMSDFNVTTPIVFDGKLLLATENNATRLYTFDEQGRIKPAPTAVNQDFAPDTSTPVVTGGRAFGTAYGELFCLDLANGLQTRWSVADDMFYDHANLIAGNDHVLIWTTTCDLLLIRADSKRYEVVSHLRPFAEKTAESMSHPALVGDRLYLRDQTRLVCIKLLP